MSEQLLPPITEVQFRSMVANDRFPLPPGSLSYMKNMYIKDGKILPRFGLKAIGSGYAGTPQLCGHYEQLDGTLMTFWIAGGVFYTYDWSLATSSGTDINLQGVTISTTALINYCVSRGRLILTDGVNTPIMYDGTTWSTLTNAPVADDCTIYYDKVFFYDIPGAENQFEWSDEADPANGYATDDQAWEFAQADTGRIVGMVGLNEVLVIFKADSIARLLGNADASFQTDAVREGISETEGLIATRSIVVVDGDVYFLSAKGPRVIRRGQQLLDPARDEAGHFMLEDVWSTFDRSTWSGSVGVFDKQNRHIIWLIPTSVSGWTNQGIVYDVDNNSWTTFAFDAAIDYISLASVESDEGRDMCLFMGDANEVYLLGDATLPVSDDNVAISRQVTTRQYGQEHPTVKLRAVEARILFDDLGGTPHLQVAPVVEGVVATSLTRLVPFPTVTGKHRHRRGLNSVGWDVGLDIKSVNLGDSFSISAIEMFFSVVESIGDRSDQ
jgi:hypothetical protein